MPNRSYTSLCTYVLAGLALTLSVCPSTHATPIDHLTLTTSAFGATNVTEFSFDEALVSDANGYFQVTIDSDPSKTGFLQYNGLWLVLDIYSGQDRLLRYAGTSSDAGRATLLPFDPFTATSPTQYQTATFTPGNYTLGSPGIDLGAIEPDHAFLLDSATVNITQDALAIPPRFPVAPPPLSPSNPATPTTTVTAVTPEPSSLLLLGTGLVSVGGFLRRRVQA